MAKLGKIFKQIAGSIAPTVARAVGGPFGGLAANVLESAFGGDPQDVIEQKLAAGDPDALLKLKQAENDLIARMRELDISEKELDVKNTQGARDLAKSTSVWFQFVLTVTAMFAFGGILYVLIIQGEIIPPENKDIAIFLVGQLSGFVAIGYNFFLGSSKGSKESKEIAARLQSPPT